MIQPIFRVICRYLNYLKREAKAIPFRNVLSTREVEKVRSVSWYLIRGLSSTLFLPMFQPNKQYGLVFQFNPWNERGFGIQDAIRRWPTRHNSSPYPYFAHKISCISFHKFVEPNDTYGLHRQYSLDPPSMENLDHIKLYVPNIIYFIFFFKGNIKLILKWSWALQWSVILIIMY